MIGLMLMTLMLHDYVFIVFFFIFQLIVNEVLVYNIFFVYGFLKCECI